MASGPVSAQQVGSYFVEQYYKVLQGHPELVHQFYNEASTMVRVDGDFTDTVTTVMQIHSLISSLNFSGIEIKTINSLDSWNGGLLVMVTGSVKTPDYSQRKFVQSFFLAPQEKGYFVLNDIFQLGDEELVVQHDPQPYSITTIIESPADAGSPLGEHPVSDYVLEESAREYIESLHVQDDPVDKYSLQEEQQQHDHHESELVVVEAPAAEVLSVSHQSALNIAQENQDQVTAAEEPVGEPPKKTYASILRVAREQYTPPVASLPSYNQSAPPPASEWDYVPTPQPQHTSKQPPLASSYGSKYGTGAAEESSALEDEGEVKSVYVRNLPSTVTSSDIEHAFKNFGRVKPGSIFIRSREEFGTCYAFVEFEDILGVQNSIQGSPIQLAGKQVYIEERRANRTSISRGGRRGRGRGSYQSDASRGRFGGRSVGRDGGEYNRQRGNGYYQRA